MKYLTLSLDNCEIDNRDTGSTELHTKDGWRIEISTDLVEAILMSVHENTPDGAEKVYIISHDEYMGVNSDMYPFLGTWRMLLEKLNAVTDENRNEPFSDTDPRTIRDLLDEELVKLFHEANGDGQPFYQVWCVEDGKKVL